MARVPAKVSKRMSSALRKFQPIVKRARNNDVSEADTVKLVLDLLEELLGYDKYLEITSQEEIRGSYCDLLVRLDGTSQFIIEVKAIGLDLTDAHVKQAVDYAANHGVDWAILTNGQTWRVYKVIFGKPIEKELVMEVDLTEISPRAPSQMEKLYNLAREGISKELLEEYHARKQATNRFLLAAAILDDPVLKVIRRELKRISPGVKVTTEEIRSALEREVLKREVVDGEEAESAARRVRGTKRPLRARRRRTALPEEREEGEAVSDEDGDEAAEPSP